MQTRDLVAHYLGMGDPRKYNSSFVMLHTVYIPTCLVPGQMLGAVGRWVGTGQGGGMRSQVEGGMRDVI